jgi:hypothetical protein
MANIGSLRGSEDVTGNHNASSVPGASEKRRVNSNSLLQRAITKTPATRIGFSELAQSFLHRHPTATAAIRGQAAARGFAGTSRSTQRQDPRL